MFYLDTYIVFAFYSFEKFSLIHDCHTSVSRWVHFLDSFFFALFIFSYLQIEIFS